MHKKLSALFLFFVFAASSSAAMKEFAAFRADVPEGWTVAEQGATVLFRAEDRPAALSVTIERIGDRKLEDIARKFSETLGGTEPLTVEPGIFHFTFGDESETPGNALVSEGNGNYTLVTMTGSHPDMERILNSLEDKAVAEDENEH